MKVYTGSIRIKTTAKTCEVNITGQVEALVKLSGISEGMALIFTGHTTAGIHLNNADKNLESDFHEMLSELIPNKPTYKHNKGDYGRNADAHLKSVVIGTSATVPLTKGRLAFGQWQSLYFSEFDGPRARLISVKVMGKAEAKEK